MARAKQVAPRRWRIVGVCAGTLFAAVLGAYALLGALDGQGPMDPGDRPNVDAASAEIAARAPGPRLSEPMPSGSAAPERGGGDASAQLGVFIDPDAQPEPHDALPVHIGEYIDADDDSPVHSDGGAVRHIGIPIDPDV